MVCYWRNDLLLCFRLMLSVIVATRLVIQWCLMLCNVLLPRHGTRTQPLRHVFQSSALLFQKQRTAIGPSGNTSSQILVHLVSQHMTVCDILCYIATCHMVAVVWYLASCYVVLSNLLRVTEHHFTCQLTNCLTQQTVTFY